MQRFLGWKGTITADATQSTTTAGDSPDPLAIQGQTIATTSGMYSEGVQGHGEIDVFTHVTARG